MKMRVWKELELEPIFSHHLAADTLDEYRDITSQRLHRFMEMDLVPDSEIMETPLKSAAIVSALGMYDWSLAAKKMLFREFFISSVSGGGIKRPSCIIKSALKGEIG